MRKRTNAEQMRERNALARQRAFKAYGGPKCACCGESEDYFLSLDHIKQNGGPHRQQVGKRKDWGGHHLYRWLAQRGFPAGYQVLCFNCNHGRRMNGGVCPHKGHNPDVKVHTVIRKQAGVPSGAGENRDLQAGLRFE